MYDPMTPLAGRIAYPAALLFGIVFAIATLSWHAVVPVDPLHAAFMGDEAQSVIGQRYFLGGPWSWPPLAAPGLGSAAGVNIALTDSIPLAMLLLKPVRGLLSPGASASEAWVALMLALQPVAAVFALRAAGERRAMPALAVAVLAVCMPALLARFGHSALCSHAAVLAALGLYLRAVDGRPAWAAAVGLMLASLLIHPYILADAAALLAAAPLTLLLRGDQGWRRAAAGFAAGVVGCGALAALLGYGGSRPAPGFGVYSMNLLAPLLPVRSALFPDLSRLMHVGDPFEGYQYLGAGVLLLAVAALVPAWRARARWRRHAGLLAVLAGLTAFSLSNDAYAGTVRLFHWDALPDVLLQFRATSRFFWPIAYAILIAGVAAARCLSPRRAALLLAAAVAVQWADTGALRRDLHRRAARGEAWQIDEPRLRPVFAAHQRLTLWPVFGCGAYAFDAQALQVLLIASQTRMPVNTIPTARDVGLVDCDPAPVRAPLAPGELRWFAHGGDVWLVPDSPALCRRSGQSALCSADPANLAGLAPVTVADLPPGQTVTGASPSFADLLGEGWSVPDGNGVWSDGDGAVLRVKAPPAGHGRLTLGVSGLAPGPGGAQTVQVSVGGALQAEWSLPDQTPVLRSLDLPPCGPICLVELRIGHPVRPVDRGMSWDARRLGVFLRSIILE